MALVTRTLTNAGAPLYSPDGDLLVGVKIHFQLMDTGGRPSDAWDAATNERVGGDVIVATTDTAGEFSVDLWPNTRGNRATKYKCRVQYEGFREFSGVVEDVSGVLLWVDFMLGGAAMTAQDMSAIAAAIASHVASADPHTQYAKEADLGTAALLDVGTTTGTVAAGDDARLSDSRAPTGAAGGVLSGTYPNPGFAVDMATQAELDAVAAAKVDKIAGKGLSTEDYSTAEKSKLTGISAGATANASDAQLRDRTTHTGAQAISSVTGLQGALDALVPAATKGAANGVASLDAGGKVPESQLPAVVISDVFSVASQAAMLALTAERGDIAVRTDINKTFALSTVPASTLGNWVELRSPTDVVQSVAGKTGAVTLVKADVGLGSVDNTPDASKPVSTAQAAADLLKVDKTSLSVTAAAGKIPIAGGYPGLDPTWLAIAIADLFTVDQLLFDAGQVGGNLSFTDFSKIWQDSAGTTPYTAVEQYVGKIIDKSPNALAFTQATSAARPRVSRRVNNLDQTETFGSADWIKVGGSFSGTKFTEDTAASSPHVLQQTSTAFAANSTITFKALVSAAGRDWCLLWDASNNRRTWFNLATGEVADTLGVLSSRITQVATGVYECEMVFTNPTASVNARCGPANDRGTAFYTGDGVSGINIFKTSLTLATDAHLPYQRVNTPTDYDTAGFPAYAKLDGIDDHWISAAGGGGTAGIYYCGAVRFNKVGAVQTIFSDTGTNSGYKLQLTAANQLQISAGNGTAFTTVNTTATFAAGDVSLVELWDDGTNLGVRLGEGTPVTVARPVVTAGTAQITLGKDNNAASNYAGINMFEPVWRYGAMPNATQREAIRATCRSKAGIV